MSKFLVYVSEQIVQDTKASNAILKALNEIGKPRPADFNVLVVDTELNGAAVQNAIEANAPDGSPYFVASVSTIGYRGDGAFVSTLRTLTQSENE